MKKLINGDNVFKALSEIPEVKRIRELENSIDNNQKIKSLFDSYIKKQHEIVFAREHNAVPLEITATKELEEIKKKMLEIPLLDEYMDLLSTVNFMLQNVSKTIEEEINTGF